ncbi:hypothetical protein Ndes2526B_g07334 [Nannochloris sp. 'desiccata']
MPTGKIAAALASGQPLTKNQKKKLKKKMNQAKESGTETDSVAPSECDLGGGGDDEGDMEVAAAAAVNELTMQSSQDVDARIGAAAMAEKSNGDGKDKDEEDDAASLDERLLNVASKIVDFGNACWVNKHFTDDIQTRQYRSPEVILGANYDTSADMWSLACMIFELVTGDFMFEPRAGREYTRDEDHLAQMVELLGKIPRSVATTGKHAREYFTRDGQLRHIHRLNFWPIDKVLVEKYRIDPAEALGLRDFLEPMLNFIPSKRATAAQSLQHAWLRGELPEAPPATIKVEAERDSDSEGDGSRERGHGICRNNHRSSDHAARERSRTRSRSAKRSLSPSR